MTKMPVQTGTHGRIAINAGFLPPDIECSAGIYGGAEAARRPRGPVVNWLNVWLDEGSTMGEAVNRHYWQTRRRTG
jgi:hypothetical protein